MLGSGTLLVFLASAAVAQAGTYEVSACDAAGGANNSWIATVTGAPWVTAYAECPSGGDPGKGMVSRNVVGPGAVVGPISARLLFNAPAGTSIVGLRASDDFYTASSAWQAVLSADTQVVRGCAVGNPPPCRWSSSDEQIQVNRAGQLGIDVYCPGSSCALSSGSADHSYVVAAARLYSAVVRIEDNTSPAVGSIGGGLWQDGWKSGTQTVAFDASDNTGIRHTAVLIDGKTVASHGHACDGTRTIPCPQGGDSDPISTAPLTDGAHQLTVQATDSAGNPGSASRRLLVDNTPPGAPQGLDLVGGEGWRSSNSFAVRWTNPKVDGAQVAGANWQLCPAVAADEKAGCVAGSKPGEAISSLTDLQVPRDGDWVLKVWLVDEAGNQTQTNAAAPVHLRVDRQPPTGVAFAPRDPANPAQVVILGADETSGIASGVLDIKPQGSESWTSVPGAVEEGRLVATLPDERLADGPYDLRGHAVDRAGNETATTTLEDGSAMTVTLPVRAKTRLLGGHARQVRLKGRRVTRFSASVRLRFGTRTSITGRLLDANGKPMTGVVLQVSEQPQKPRAVFKATRTVKTSRRGTFSFHTARGGTSRVVRVRYPGAPTIRPAEFDVRVGIAAMSTMRISDRSVRRGASVRFTGKLLGGHIPAGGKLVQLQALVNGHWQVFANPRANSHGRWQHLYRFSGNYRNARLAFRVRIPRDPSYPFAVGTSLVARVSVRGP